MEVQLNKMRKEEMVLCVTDLVGYEYAKGIAYHKSRSRKVIGLEEVAGNEKTKKEERRGER